MSNSKIYRFTESTLIKLIPNEWISNFHLDADVIFLEGFGEYMLPKQKL